MVDNSTQLDIRYLYFNRHFSRIVTFNTNIYHFVLAYRNCTLFVFVSKNFDNYNYDISQVIIKITKVKRSNISKTFQKHAELKDVFEIIKLKLIVFEVKEQ